MEELRSTEALDREILEDARKKAFKLLKTADENIQSQSARWEKKTGDAVNEIRQNYQSRTERTRDEILARGPLDKRRLRCETSEAFLKEAMNSFLLNLKRGQLLSILKRDLSRQLDACPEFALCESGAEISCFGLSEAEAAALIQDTALKTNFRLCEKNDRLAGFPMMILDSGEVRITVSTGEIAFGLLENNRAELITALCGEGALND